MKTFFSPSASLEDFAALLAEIDRQNHGTLIVFAGDANQWPETEISQLLRSADTPVFGGIFPQIAFNDGSFEQGAVIMALAERPDCALVTGMSEVEANYEDQILAQVDHWDSASEPGTLMVLVDGLARRISALVQDLFYVFGLESNFIGGGAGSLSFEQRTCILTPQGLLADAAVIIKLPRPSSIGVTHGWTSISEVMEVTEADRNVIKSINWQPAFEVYKRIVDEHSRGDLQQAHFFDTAKSYPLGMLKLGAEMVVRDPLMVSGAGELVCVGEVPRGALVRVLKGSSESLLTAASQARACIDADGKTAGGPLMLFDCISRVLFLGPDIHREMALLSCGEPVFGAFTLGEIANNGQDYLEFLNKTTVLARIGP